MNAKTLFVGLGLCLSLGTQAIAQQSGLVAYYPFIGNANDLSGFSRNGTVHGATLTTDRFGVTGNAYAFDGVGDYIDASSPINDVLNTFTTSMWFITTEVHKEDRFANFLIQPSHGETTWGDSSVGAGISAGTDKLKVWEHTHDYRVVVLEYAGTFNEWNFVTLVYSNRVPSLYVNGAFIKRGNVSPRSPVRPSNGHKLSARNQQGGFGGGETVGGDSYWFKGSIDEIRIYNRALPDSEIAALYESERRPQPTVAITVKTVQVTMLVSVGRTYRLESSKNLLTWNPTGPAFVAQASETVQTFDVTEIGQYFRLLEITSP